MIRTRKVPAEARISRAERQRIIADQSGRPASSAAGARGSQSTGSAVLAPRVLHVVETWRPVASGYTSRGWQIVGHGAEVSRPFVLVSSRQSLHGFERGEAPPGLVDEAVCIAPESRAEKHVRRWRAYHIDASNMEAEIVRACRGWAIDIVHCHWSSAIGAAARRAAERLDLAFVAEVRFDLAGAMMSETVRRPIPGLETLLRLRFERHLLGADAVVAASHSLATLIAGSQPLLTAPIEVMPNAVDTTRFKPDSDARLRLRDALGLADAFVVGSTTNMLRYEGLDVLLDVIEHLRPRVPNVHCLLVGDGTQRPALAEAAAARGLPVTFTGRVPAAAVPDYLNAFDVFAVPRRDSAVTRYASPIKLVEAMACGVPAVGSELGDIPAILASGGGQAVLADDIDAFAGAIASLAHDRDRRDQQALEARSWALDQPDWPALARRYAALYDRVLVNRDRHR